MKSFLKSLAAAARWHRRGLAAMAAFIAVLATLTVLRPAAPPSHTVVVTTQAVPAGATLSLDMIKLTKVPIGVSPDGAVDRPDQLVGAAVIAPLPRGAILTREALVDGSRRLPAGQVVVPLRIGDASVVNMLRVGDLVSVVGRDPQGRPVPLARGVQVVALPQTSDPSGPLGGSSTSGGLVLVQTDHEVGTALAVAATAGGLGLMMG